MTDPSPNIDLEDVLRGEQWLRSLVNSTTAWSAGNGAACFEVPEARP